MMEENKVSQEKTENAKKIAKKSSGNRSVFASIEENIIKLFRWISSIIDRLFFSSKYSVVFALLLALLAYYVATYDDTNNSLSSSKVLSGISTSARYNSESFELSGLPTACDIVISGDAANVNNASSKKGYCQIDLEGYTEGTHTVKMNAMGYGENVNTIVSPSEVTITLKKKTTMQFDLSYDLINQNLFDKTDSITNVTFSQGNKINVRASQDTLNSIALVKALVDPSQIDIETLHEAHNGETDWDDSRELEAPIAIFDKNGKTIEAEIVPSVVTATVTIERHQKEVAIVLNPIGSVPTGFAIDSVEMADHQTVMIYGPSNVLANINEIGANFDMSTVTENADSEIMLPLNIPSGVTASDINVVNVKVSLATISSKTIEDVPIIVKNNNNNLAISDIEFKEVDVIVSGSERNIENITIDDIEVSFDMPNDVGDYTQNLTVVLKKNGYVYLTPVKPSITLTTIEGN